MTGACAKGKCVCDANMYACGNCAAQATVVANPADPTQYEYTTLVPVLNGSGGSVDICEFPRGGGACSTDAECGGSGGLCLGSRCVCPMGRLCADCTLTQTDLQYGLACAKGVSDGGAKCKSTADCGKGTCLATGTNQNFCQCNALWVCPRCNVPLAELVKNASACWGV